MTGKAMAALMSEMGDSVLDHATEVCNDASTDDMFFVPVIIIAAIQPGEPAQLVASNCMFGANQPLKGVAALLKKTAASLLGDIADTDEVTVTIDGGGFQ